jgi:hypothetical protein
MIMEAVAIKARAEEEQAIKEAEKKAKRQQFKDDRSSLEKFR